MLAEQIKRRVELATVRVVGKGGQGVLVPGGYILTAAHCVTWNGEGGMALGDWHIEQLQPKRGAPLLTSVCAVEPVTDIAALEAPDSQEFFDECYAFKEWCDETEPLPLSTRTLKVNESMPAHLLTHKGAWVTATLTRYGVPGTLPGGRVCIRPGKPIKGGTSGGPVVDDRGHLIGVISWASESHPAEGGMIPVAHLALPGWVLADISAAGKRKRARAANFDRSILPASFADRGEKEK